MALKHEHDSVLRLPQECFQGRVFVVGDVHGCHDLVLRAMDRARLDPAVDTVIFLGDLIDRGPQSAESLAMLREPFVYSILGNHEDMLLRAQTDERWAADFIRNGGRWWLHTSDSQRQDILDLLRTLPVAIEASTPQGTIGFVHADVPFGLDWQRFTQYVREGDERTIMAAIWSRKRFESSNANAVVLGVDRVFIGHTIQDAPRRLGNVFAIDTGAFMNDRNEGYLTVANVLCAPELLFDRPVATEDGVNLVFDHDVAVERLFPRETGVVTANDPATLLRPSY